MSLWKKIVPVTQIPLRSPGSTCRVKMHRHEAGDMLHPHDLRCVSMGKKNEWVVHIERTKERRLREGGREGGNR
ncbi:hypothetical protein MPTK1_7g10340 [Marchantia polymorpha subsp. ruderalis]|uniref:Uncharacterized protein n=2 Tax=Marchantia polymorpha TaxID=3197 RepID=A0AAF6BY25_MARPO|nr:hypothetical protein MARPO_0003s0053 [Marchantia polymorpha]BBN16909.1 hypothetical protein Mp_7g10340 [Marchantia polymorpha subsp. ruderalis]|eukprot:PTQ49150.1 hypothetical protein MARPO_0003s0053 [Marchantia polymorpha]